MSTGERKQLMLPLAAASLALLLMVAPAVARRSSRMNAGSTRVNAGSVQSSHAQSSQLIASKLPGRRIAQGNPAAATASPTPAAPAVKVGTPNPVVPAAVPPPAGAVKTTAAAPDELSVDTALMSVLKDLSKSARESDDVQKLEDPAQKAAIKAALDLLDAAVKRANANPDRIVVSTDKSRFEKTLNAESWDSGMVAMPNNARGSVSIVWAKKVNGLVNVSIAGNCGCRGEGAGRIGQYVVVINGKSTLDSGFDIQSQSDVNFWLGKMTAINADATTCGEGQVKTESPPTLKALVTDDSVRRQAELASRLQQEEERRQQLATQEAVAQHMAAQQVPMPPLATDPATIQQFPLPTAQAGMPGAPAAVADRSPTPGSAVTPAGNQIRSSQESVMVLPELKPPISIPTPDSQ